MQGAGRCVVASWFCSVSGPTVLFVFQHGFLKQKSSNGIPVPMPMPTPMPMPKPMPILLPSPPKPSKRRHNQSHSVTQEQAIRRRSGHYGLASSRQRQPHFVSVVDPLSCCSTFALPIFLRQPPLPPTAVPLLCLTSLPFSRCCSHRTCSPHTANALDCRKGDCD